ncbi:hypothetical protein CEQ21_16225 [Niallia circulans]|uniref:Uncharacterized protein n=1 Tax=Niallia circulans TaxID=1397 RepID=A0A553SJ75_NIACI|nr:hypothetical protein [Niallia circulans]TRZ37036.1 hypothetical protein CEQ21_16225 [Niallia circulans]
MKRSFLIALEPSHTLNFMIYLQNIYLQQENAEYRKFPYIKPNVIFHEDFAQHFKELWEELTEKMIEGSAIDSELFVCHKDMFYDRLFIGASKDNEEAYTTIYDSFKVWWESMAGGFSIESSVYNKLDQLYSELTSFPDTTASERLDIKLIYDQCLLGGSVFYRNFAILSIDDFYINYKKIIPKLRQCIADESK